MVKIIININNNNKTWFTTFSFSINIEFLSVLTTNLLNRLCELAVAQITHLSEHWSGWDIT